MVTFQSLKSCHSCHLCHLCHSCQLMLIHVLYVNSKHSCQIMSNHVLQVKSCHSCQIMSFMSIHVNHVIHIKSCHSCQKMWCHSCHVTLAEIQLSGEGWVGQICLPRPLATVSLSGRRQRVRARAFQSRILYSNINVQVKHQRLHCCTNFLQPLMCRRQFGQFGDSFAVRPRAKSAYLSIPDIIE
jgi:hypothetical protein